ncbi:MAG: hypothetical protein C5B49_00480 [Bdellovibrio sp.]|nr:MAG: hypothetical protein C5B49_00480 [Bdellovibrio sp.]
MSSHPSCASVLVQGIGNPLRGDDGLGPALIERLQNLWQETTLEPTSTVDPDSAVEPDSTVEPKPTFEFEWVYQLQVEDAERWIHFREVVLVDAHLRQTRPIELRELQARPLSGFSTHGLEPAGVLALAKTCFKVVPRVHLLSLRGVDFTMGAPLSGAGEASLGAALEWFKARWEQSLTGPIARGWNFASAASVHDHIQDGRNGAVGGFE